ncbi:hypothetical protein HAX54_000140 [Datura stramonium]|uniref:Uncharacterized protein n=1 Tax=Datura stramonium TaxID=4076 RepID=A0ABS8T1H0_DATST|nr:hypothetical protein [Datura stramonium]
MGMEVESKGDGSKQQDQGKNREKDDNKKLKAAGNPTKEGEIGTQGKDKEADESLYKVEAVWKQKVNGYRMFQVV